MLEISPPELDRIVRKAREPLLGERRLGEPRVTEPPEPPVPPVPPVPIWPLLTRSTPREPRTPP